MAVLTPNKSRRATAPAGPTQAAEAPTPPPIDVAAVVGEAQALLESRVDDSSEVAVRLHRRQDQLARVAADIGEARRSMRDDQVASLEEGAKRLESGRPAEYQPHKYRAWMLAVRAAEPRARAAINAMMPELEKYLEARRRGALGMADLARLDELTAQKDTLAKLCRHETQGRSELLERCAPGKVLAAKKDIRNALKNLGAGEGVAGPPIDKLRARFSSKIEEIERLLLTGTWEELNALDVSVG